MVDSHKKSGEVRMVGALLGWRFFSFLKRHGSAQEKRIRRSRGKSAKPGAGLFKQTPPPLKGTELGPQVCVTI